MHGWAFIARRPTQVFSPVVTITITIPVIGRAAVILGAAMILGVAAILGAALLHHPAVQVHPFFQLSFSLSL